MLGYWIWSLFIADLNSSLSQLTLSAAGLFKYVWPFCYHQTLRVNNISDATNQLLLSKHKYICGCQVSAINRTQDNGVCSIKASSLKNVLLSHGYICEVVNDSLFSKRFITESFDDSLYLQLTKRDVVHFFLRSKSKVSLQKAR